MVDPNAMGDPGVHRGEALALISISALLFIVLRRVTHVLLTLVPLLLAGVVTFEIPVLIGLPLNFADIIALPLLLDLLQDLFRDGVAGGDHEPFSIEP